MSNEASPVNEEAVGTEEAVPAEEQRAETSVKKGGLAVGLVIVLSLTWYLLADRFTPYTSQARVQGYVVGVAPKVAGKVTQIRVENNQLVEQGQPLFEIDLSGAIGIVMGAEGEGMRRLTEESCDFLASIPMAGTVPCLNVSVATGVCLFEAVRQRQVKSG